MKRKKKCKKAKWLKKHYKNLRNEEKQKAKENGKIDPNECRVPD